MSNKLVVIALKNILADSYALYLKTQNYHWNVEGPIFKALHLLFEEQYTDLAEAIDTAAELIRGLGEKVPSDMHMKSASIKIANQNSSAQEMVKELAEDQVLMQKTLQQAFEAAQKASDEVVVNFIVERLTIHRKAAWMLMSSL